MLLKKLINNISKEKKKIKINGLSANSNNIKKNFIFFAIKGHTLNGEKFINRAIRKGAAVIVCSKNCKFNSEKIPIIKTSNVRNFLSEVASKFYKKKPKNIIAVTGTNGKTSVSDLFYQILKKNNYPVASIGTLGIKFKNKVFKSNLTSPDTILLHKTLEKIKKEKIDNVILEASSHGLHQKRIEHLNIKAGIFTNFSQDHLDYHKTMQSYLNSKLHLFKNILGKRKFLICSSESKEYSILKKISKSRKLRFINANTLKEKLIKNKNIKFRDFQLNNLSMAIAAAKIVGVKEKNIFNTIKKLNDADGRLELVKTFPNNVKVYVDFAHTPDALFKALKFLKINQGKSISLVFGCGGDRDFKKRPLMAEIASSNCKNVYVTDDNPRNERPEKIRTEIIRNIKNLKCFNIGNREKAIKTAIIKAEPNEIILVAGKGHEVEQIYKNKIISVSDKKIIKSLKVGYKKISSKNKNFGENQKILNEIKKVKKLRNFHGLAIDSRVIKKDNLFITIKGKNNNGIKFIPNALKKGAAYIITSKNIKKYKDKIIKVENEIKFLNDFASKKRQNTDAKIIAITGSAGKTSLKNLIKDLLQNFDQTIYSPKSYNNHFGVPLSLSQLNKDHKFGVFEVGMSRPGEIDNLSKLIKPNIAVITNIGEAHIENFKNLSGIAKAKGEIIKNIEKNGTIILNRDDKFFNYFSKKAKKNNLKIISFGLSKKSDFYPFSINKIKKKKILKVKVGKKILKLQIKNINIYNILSSLAVIKELNLDCNKIINYYKSYEPVDGRGKIHNIKRYNKNFKLIDESYNANPLSVKNALQNFSSIQKNKFKKYLLLGDMLELGRHSEKLHENLSKVINTSDIDKVFIKGVKTLSTYKNIHKSKRGNIFQHEEDLDFTFSKIISNNDYLMIKGSNATGLKNFSKRIIKG